MFCILLYIDFCFCVHADLLPTPLPLSHDVIWCCVHVEKCCCGRERGQSWPPHRSPKLPVDDQHVHVPCTYSIYIVPTCSLAPLECCGRICISMHPTGLRPTHRRSVFCSPQQNIHADKRIIIMWWEPDARAAEGQFEVCATAPHHQCSLYTMSDMVLS